MHQALRPYATAGVAIVGASLVALTPVATPTPDLHGLRDVRLTSGVGDLLTPWIDQYNTAADNASLLANNFFLAPGVAMQQFWVNINDFAEQVLDDPSNLTAVTEEMRDHYKAVLSGLTLTDADKDVSDQVTKFTIDGDHSLLYGLLPNFLPADQAETLTPIIHFLGSPMSAIIIGALGPSISPLVALGNSLTDGDGLSETLANMTGAFFNGATLDLDSLLPAINGAGLLPEGMSFDHLDFAFGGLFSPGETQMDPWRLFDDNGDPSTSIPVVGGSIFNSVGLNIGGVPVLGSIDMDGQPIGPLAAWQSLSELIGLQLGSQWNVAPGKGAATLPAGPPGAGIQFPTIPDDAFGGDSGTAAATAAVDTEPWTELSDAITNFQWSDVF